MKFRQIFLLLLLVPFLSSCFKEIPPRHEAFKNRKYRGGIDTTSVRYEGNAFFGFGQEWIVWDIGQVTTLVDCDDALDQNGLNVNVEVKIVTQVQRGNSWRLEQEVGETYIEGKVVPYVENAVRLIVGQYDAKDLYSTQRDALENQIRDEVAPKLDLIWVDVIEVLVTDVDLPAQLESQLLEKETQKERNRTAELKQAENKALADAAVETARGDSLSSVIRAAGTAAEIEQINRAMRSNPNYLEYLTKQAELEQVRKWDGSYGTGNWFGGATDGVMVQRGN
jgi:regulator of protease activity HflC (stomatin/prohibitin superfamily)